MRRKLQIALLALLSVTFSPPQAIGALVSAYISDYHLNKVPAIFSNIDATTSPLIFPEPVTDVAKFGVIIRVSNPASESFSGFLEISRWTRTTPSGVTRGSDPTPGWYVDRVTVGNIPPQSHNDVFVPLPHNEIGEWQVDVALKTGSVLTGVSQLDEVSIEYNVLNFDEAPYTCRTMKHHVQQLGTQIPSPTAFSSSQLDYASALVGICLTAQLFSLAVPVVEVPVTIFC